MSSTEKTRRLISSGLHFCRHYKNLVRYNPEFCGKCPHNGLRPPTGEAD
jgi:hypothetical protein